MFSSFPFFLPHLRVPDRAGAYWSTSQWPTRRKKTRWHSLFYRSFSLSLLFLVRLSSLSFFTYLTKAVLWGIVHISHLDSKLIPIHQKKVRDVRDLKSSSHRAPFVYLKRFFTTRAIISVRMICFRLKSELLFRTSPKCLNTHRERERAISDTLPSLMYCLFSVCYLTLMPVRCISSTSFTGEVIFLCRKKEENNKRQ